MLRTRSRKILRDILSRKFRTLMVSTSIFVGVLGVVALFTTNDLLISTMEEDLKPEELAMINVAVTVPNSAELDNAAYLAMLNQQNELGQSLGALDGIQYVEGSAVYPIGFRKPDAKTYEDAFLKSYSVPLEDRQIEPLQLAAGEWPVVGNNEIALEKRMAKEFGFEVGDSIVFRSVSAEGVQDVEYTVAGLVYHPYILDPETYPEDSLYAQYADAQAILGVQGYNGFVARYETFELAENHFKDFQQVINEQTPYFPIFALLENPVENRAVQSTKDTGGVLNMLAMVAMIVAGFLVVNVINSIVVEQKKQIGVIKSIGGTQVDNFYIYAGMALIYGVIGTVPGVLLGLPLGFQMAKAMGKQFSILIEEFSWSPPALAIGIIMGLAVPVLAAVIPVFNGTRITIIEAMTDFGISSVYGQGRLERLIGRLPIPISIRQALSNTMQKKGRLALTGITLTLAIGAFMGVLAVTISLIEEVNAIFDRMNYQIVAVPNETQDQQQFEAQVAAIDGVDSVSPMVYILTPIEGTYTNFFTNDNQVETLGIDTSSNLFNFNLKSGTGWADDPNREGVVIASPMAGQLGVEAGDDITFWVSGKRVTLPVIGVDVAAFDIMYMEWQQLAELAGLTEEANAAVETLAVDGLATPVVGVGLSAQEAGMVDMMVQDGEGFGADFANPGVVITAALAEAGNFEASSVLNITAGDTTAEYPVAGVVTVPEDIAAQVGLPDEAILFNAADLATLVPVPTGGVPVPNAYAITIDQVKPTSKDVDGVIERLDETLLGAGIVGSYQNQIGQAEEITGFIGVFRNIMLIAAMLIALVGAVGLLTTLSMNVFERQKEIGVMRSIGAGSFTIVTQFLSEGLLVGLSAWIIGIPISYFLAVTLNSALNLETIDFSYRTIVPVIGLVSMIGITLVSSIGPSLGAARKTVSDILRYQ